MYCFANKYVELSLKNKKKLRAKLEDELMELRQAQTGNTDPNLRPGDSIEEFRRKLSDAEEKVHTHDKNKNDTIILLIGSND